MGEKLGKPAERDMKVLSHKTFDLFSLCSNCCDCHLLASQAFPWCPTREAGPILAPYTLFCKFSMLVSTLLPPRLFFFVDPKIWEC